MFRHDLLIALALMTSVVVSCEEMLAVQDAQAAGKAVAAQAKNWTLYRGDHSLKGVAPGKISSDLELAWTLDTEGAITASPVVENGIVYIGSNDGVVYAVKLKTGEQVWSYGTDDMIEAPVLVHDGRVYVGSNDFFFYALDAKTGALAWKFECQDKIMGSANIWKDEEGKTRIIFGSHDNNLYSLDAKTGEKLWNYTTDNYVNGTPAILGDSIVFGGCDAVLHVVSAATGKSKTKIELGDDCHIAGSVALADGRVYLGHYGNEFICADLAASKIVWKYPSRSHAFFSSPSIGRERVVFGGRDKKMHCVQKADGKPLWAYRTKRKIDGSPLICGDKVVFGSGDGRLYMLNLADGKELWKYEIGRAVYSSPAIVDGMLLIGANDKRLYAFKPAS